MVRRRRGFLWNCASLSVLILASSVSRAAAGIGVATGEPREALLTVTVNGVPDSDPQLLLMDGAGRVFASSDELAGWRLTTARLPAILHGGSRYYLLNAVPGARIDVDDARQELRLTVPPADFPAVRLSYRDVEIPDEVVSGTGGFVNYDADADASGGRVQIGASLEAGLFTPKGVGTSGFVARSGAAGAGLVRLDSSWTMNDPGRMRTVRIGDSVSMGGPGGSPVRFAGLQLARDFAMQPGFVTFPVPSIRGSAQVPSVADVYVNDVLTRSSNVSPGPFDITDIPVVTGSGQVQLIVHDMLGREQLVSESYYASSSLLRRGLDDYSYELGFLRRSYGVRSNDYGALMVSATQRYGLTDQLTGEVHLEAAQDVQEAGAGATFVLPQIGEVDVTAAASRSGRGGGYYAAFTLDRHSSDFSFGVHSEIASRDYTTVGEVGDKRPPAFMFQAFAGMRAGSGSFGLSFLHRDGRTEPDVDLASVNWSARLGRLGTLNLAARTSLGGPKATAAELLLVVPLGFSAGASAGAKLDGGTVGMEASLQKSVPLGTGIGYRIDASTGALNRVHGRLTVRTDFADFATEVTWLDHRTGVRFAAAGAVGIVGGHPFLSKRLDESFGRVEVGNYAGVRVYADNQLVGRTGSDGSLIVPDLRPYDGNVVRIDPSDLPPEAEIAQDEAIVRPAARNGVVVKFAAKSAEAAFLKVVLADGTPLPTGSSIELGGHSGQFVSASGGEVYLTGIDRPTIAVAQWAKGRCEFTATPTGQATAAPNVQVQCVATAR